jgi:NADH-quinone oxidoreductase subunit M
MALPLPAVIVASPLAAALLLLAIPARARKTVRAVAIASTLISLAGAIAVAVSYDTAAGGIQFHRTIAVVPSAGIDLEFGVDGWGLSLLLLTAIIIFAGAWASWSVKDRDKDFYILLLTLVTGVFGVFVSLNLFVFFLFYEIAVLPMYLLIGIWGSTKKIPSAGPLRFAYRRLDVGGREYAAMKLTLMLLAGSALILVGILALYFAAGRSTFSLLALQQVAFPRALQLWAFPALWIGFGTLAGVFPFHTWSPDGHASAPTAVSMLHAGVLMKLGAFGVIRVGMILLPEGARHWAFLMGCVAVVNIVYGALSAMAQKDLKYIVAYSSVSHMGVVMLGAATLTVDGWNGAVYQMFAHGLMTGLFFALVGLIYEKAHSREVFQMGGFARVMPGIAVFFTVACLSSLGMPGLAGFVAEFLVFLGAWRGTAAWWGVAGVLGAWLTAVYVLRVSRAIFWGEGPSERYPGLVDARGTEWVALVTLGLCLVLFGSWPRLVLDAIDASTAQHLQAVTGALLGMR